MTVRVSKRNAKKRRRSKSRKKAKESLFKRLFSRSRSKRRRRSKSKKKHRRRRARSKSKRSKSKRSKSKRRQSKRASERRMLGRIHDEVADFIEDNSDFLAYGLEAVAVMAGVVQLAKYLLPKAHDRYNKPGSRYKKFYDYLTYEPLPSDKTPWWKMREKGLVPRMRDEWQKLQQNLKSRVNQLEMRAKAWRKGEAEKENHPVHIGGAKFDESKKFGTPSEIPLPFDDDFKDEKRTQA